MRRTTGKFIVLEGIDGSGKSEQIRRLQELFGSREDVFFTQEPSGGLINKRLIGPALRGELNTDFDPQTLQFLFTADRSDHLTQEILPRIEDGVSVICDRYVLSTFAYGGSSISQKLRDVNLGFVSPDLTLFISISPDVVLERIRARGEKASIFENADRLYTIAKAYDMHVSALSDDHNIIIIDGKRSVAEVFADVKQHVEQLLKQGGQ